MDDRLFEQGGSGIRFKDQFAIATDGSCGIGFATAEAFLKEGAVLNVDGMARS